MKCFDAMAFCFVLFKLHFDMYILKFKPHNGFIKMISIHTFKI